MSGGEWRVELTDPYLRAKVVISGAVVEAVRLDSQGHTPRHWRAP